MHGGGHIGHIAAHDCRRYRAIGGSRVGHADFDFVENIIESVHQILWIIGMKIILGLAGSLEKIITSPFG